MHLQLLISLVLWTLGDCQQPCKTKNEKLGSCDLMSNCPHLLPEAKALSAVEFLATYSCGRSNGKVIICCPLEETREQLVNATNRHNLPTKPPSRGQIRNDATCKPPFRQFYRDSCIFIYESYLGWEAAQQMCNRLDAQLYVAPDPNHLDKLRNYLLHNEFKEHFWVGVREKKWTSGRSVDPKEWRTGQPDGSTEECGFLGFNRTPNSFYLYDGICDSECFVICHKRSQ